MVNPTVPKSAISAFLRAFHLLRNIQKQNSKSKKAVKKPIEKRIIKSITATGLILKFPMFFSLKRNPIKAKKLSNKLIDSDNLIANLWFKTGLMCLFFVIVFKI
jgi:hypothetical protein